MPKDLVGSLLIGCQIENMNPDVTPYRMSLDVCINPYIKELSGMLL
jgi:hypothetical protein